MISISKPLDKSSCNLKSQVCKLVVASYGPWNYKLPNLEIHIRIQQQHYKYHTIYRFHVRTPQLEMSSSATCSCKLVNMKLQIVTWNVSSWLQVPTWNQLVVSSLQTCNFKLQLEISSWHHLAISSRLQVDMRWRVILIIK